MLTGMIAIDEVCDNNRDSEWGNGGNDDDSGANCSWLHSMTKPWGHYINGANGGYDVGKILSLYANNIAVTVMMMAGSDDNIGNDGCDNISSSLLISLAQL